MPKGDAFAEDLLRHIFLNDPIANIGDATGLPASGTTGSLYLTLHVADPSDIGTATSSDANYVPYARQAVARTSANWSVSGKTVTLLGDVIFPEVTSGTETITHIGVTMEASGASVLMFRTSLETPISLSPGFTPFIEAGSVITEE